MTEHRPSRERALWIVIVAVLATSLMWLTTLSMFALFGAHALPLPQAIVVLRALGRVALALASRVWLGLPLFALAGIMLALAFHRRAPLPREVRDA